MPAKKPKKDAAAMFEALAGEVERQEPASPTPPPAESVPKKRGRPPGKRSDPAYTQIGAYIPKDLYRRVMKAIADRKYSDANAPDLSDVVAALLEQWLRESGKR